MTKYSTFTLLAGYTAFTILMMMVFSIGSILSIAATGIALVVYYPFKVWEYLVSKFTKGVK